MYVLKNSRNIIKANGQTMKQCKKPMHIKNVNEYRRIKQR